MQPVTVRLASAADIQELSDLFIELDEHHMRRRPAEFAVLKQC